MVLPQFEYLAPATIGEACNLLLELGEGAKVMRSEERRVGKEGG